jgi:hypothetical protein
MYSYPLQLSFKILAFGPQIYVRDAGGNEVFYVHMKAFKLREAISIYRDSSKSTQLYKLGADRIIDFSATYHITDTADNRLGSIKREGMRSLWKASYNILDATGNILYHIKEDKPWVKVMDALLSEIPIVGMFAGYMFHPSYTTYRSGPETPVYRITKEPAFLEGKFKAEQLDPALSDNEHNLVLLGNLMMTLIERMRG